MDFESLWTTLQEYLFEHQVLGIDIWRYFASVLVFLVIYLARRHIVSLVMGVIARFTKRTKTDWDDMVFEAIQPPMGAALQVLNVYAALFILNLPRQPTNWPELVDTTAIIALQVVAFWAGLRSVRIVTLFLSKVTAKTQSPLDDRLVPFIDRVLRVVVVILGVLMVLQQAGVEITSLLAGLGIGGLAVALAAKDTLSNVFGTITIVGDYPFDVGDWIKTSYVEGTVEDIGFRSTKVRTFGNSLVSVPNAKLAGSPIENFSRMFKRRISFRLAVTYETTPQQMREALARIRDLLSRSEDIRQDFWLVYFTDFADSAMEIMVYCFTHTTVWGDFLAVREKLNLQIVDALEEIGVEFAFPSRAVYMREDDPDERLKHSERCAAILEQRQRRDGDDDAGAASAATLARGANDDGS